MSKAEEEYQEWKEHCVNWGCLEQKDNYIKELKEYNSLLIKLIDSCCYDEDFDADYVINKLKELKLDYE